MHQTRQETSMKIPIQRKGTKYIARALDSPRDSIAIVIALRDMLHLAKTAKEVNEMIKAKSLKINGRIVEDYRESIKLFSILEADKFYVLTILPTKRFSLEEAKDKEKRPCKVIGKKLLRGKKIQLNLHDGSNLISSENINVGDTVYLDFKGKAKSSVKLEKGKKVMAISGKYIGLLGKVENIEGKILTVKFADKEEEVTLPSTHIIVL